MALPSVASGNSRPASWKKLVDHRGDKGQHYPLSQEACIEKKAMVEGGLVDREGQGVTRNEEAERV
jgi:hypothetical protein